MPTASYKEPIIGVRHFVLAACVGLVLLVSCCSSVTVVDTGHRGIKTVFGKVEEPPLPEGIYFTSPFTTHIHPMDIRTQKFSDKTEVYTKDVQTAAVEYTVNFSVKPEQAGELFQTVGVDYADKLIPQVVQGGLKNAAGKWDAVDIISNREKVRAEVETALTAALAPRGVVIEGFQLVDVGFTKEFDAAVENKVIAIQKADQARNETVTVGEKAKQAVITAQGDAQAMKIKSDALSQNQNLVAYEAVQHWDGKLPDTVYMGAGSPLPFLNVNK